MPSARRCLRRATGLWAVPPRSIAPLSAAAEGPHPAALDRVTAAREHARSIHAIPSWLATIEATIHADRGDHAAARDALDRGQTTLNQPGSHRAPASFHYHGTAQLTAATSHILSRADHYSHAREVLTATVSDPYPIGRKQQVLILVDLVATELHSGNLAAACLHATQAAELLHQAAYAVGTAHLRPFRKTAQQSMNGRALRALDDQLTRITA